MAFSNHDVVPDSPINNFATLSPIASHINAVTTDQLENGNLICHTRGVSGVTVNMGISSMYFPREGKWYFEILLRDGSDPYMWSGIQNESHTRYVTYYFDKIYYFDSSGNLTYTTISNSTSVRGVHGFLVDFDTGSFTTYHNGAANNPVSFNHFNDEKFYIYIDDGSSNHQTSQVLNAGQDPTFNGDPYLAAGAGSFTPDNGIGSFAFLPVDSSGNPITDFKALCTANLPEGPIKLIQDQTPSDHFKAVTWVGDGSPDGVKIQTGFKPDLIWAKNRDGSHYHQLHDSVRGSEGGVLYSNASDSQDPTYAMKSFDADGFTLGDQLSAIHPNGNKVVAWCWRAAGNPADNQAKIINEDGTQADATCTALATAATNSGASNVITPSKVSANRQNGFSIVKYVGNGLDNTETCIPHGLNQKLDMLIVKNIDISGRWHVIHSGLDPSANYGTKQLLLNSTNGQGDYSDRIHSLGSSNSFVVASDDSNGNMFVNSNQHNYIAYCWHSVKNYSKSGSYVGNGSVDGPYVELGFRPAWVMCKCVSTTNNYSSWIIYDSARAECNPTGLTLHANSSVQEGKRTQGDDASSCVIDFLSNGFKFRNDWSEGNRSNEEFIFMAFAEQPFSGPSNAR